jgi:hypothetical protein
MASTAIFPFFYEDWVSSSHFPATYEGSPILKGQAFVMYGLCMTSLSYLHIFVSQAEK